VNISCSESYWRMVQTCDALFIFSSGILSSRPASRFLALIQFALFIDFIVQSSCTNNLLFEVFPTKQKDDVDMAGLVCQSRRCLFSALDWDGSNYANIIKFIYIVKQIGNHSNKITTAKKLTLLSLYFLSCDVSVRSGSSSSGEYDLHEPFALFFLLSKRGCGEKA